MLAGSESRSLGVSGSEILQDCHSERSSLSQTESDPSADLALPGESVPHNPEAPMKSAKTLLCRNSSFWVFFSRVVFFLRPDKPLYCWLWENAKEQSWSKLIFQHVWQNWCCAVWTFSVIAASLLSNFYQVKLLFKYFFSVFISIFTVLLQCILYAVYTLEKKTQVHQDFLNRGVNIFPDNLIDSWGKIMKSELL